MKTTTRTIVWENPHPTFLSRHAFFPGMEILPSGKIIALFPIGQAFEAWDQRIHISESSDRGITWEAPRLLSADLSPGLGVLKPTLLIDGTLMAIGYWFEKTDARWINKQTGGMPPSGKNIVTFSRDGGKSWSTPVEIVRDCPAVLEISGPAVQLENGDIGALGTPMPLWDGSHPVGSSGRFLRSSDGGLTWNYTSVYFKSSTITPLEARLVRMRDNRLVAIVWALNERTGVCLNNHICISCDNGYNWSDPIDTGIAAQAANLIALPDNRLLSIHAHRENDPAGIFVRLTDLTDNRWNVQEELCILNAGVAGEVHGFADMGHNLKFGQPSLLAIGNDEFLAYYWSIENCQGRIIAHHLTL